MSRAFEDGPAPQYDGNVISKIKEKCPQVFIVCFRDKNKNLMIYQARVKDNKLMNPPIESYWLILEPSYQQARKKQKIHHDREEPSFLDHRFAWGFEQKRISDTEATFGFKNHPYPMTVKINEKGEAQLFCHKDNRMYLIRSLYIASSENIHLFNLKSNVKTLSITGFDVTAKPFQPKIIYLVGGPN